MKKLKRAIWNAIIILYPGDAKKRTEFIKKHHLLGSIGDNCSIQQRKIPLNPELIFLHNNVRIASNVGFGTHDVIHRMLNVKYKSQSFIERVGCIEIMDNVFVGSRTVILYNTKIGSNVIIGSNSLVNKDIPDNSVYAGIPARYICSFDEYVNKARKYSESVREMYNIGEMPSMNKYMATKIHETFLKERSK